VKRGAVLPQAAASRRRAVWRAPSALARAILLPARWTEALELGNLARPDPLGHHREGLLGQPHGFLRQPPLLLRDQEIDEADRGLGQDGQPLGLVVPARELLLRLGQPAPGRPLAAQLDELAQADRRLGPLEAAARARAGELLDLKLQLRIRPQAGLQGPCFSDAQVPGGRCQPGVVQEGQGQGLPELDHARRFDPVRRAGRRRVGNRRGRIDRDVTADRTRLRQGRAGPRSGTADGRGKRRRRQERKPSSAGHHRSPDRE
jgi:hypothetical protein